jgi:hypothetical protein
MLLMALKLYYESISSMSHDVLGQDQLQHINIHSTKWHTDVQRNMKRRAIFQFVSVWMRCWRKLM